MSEEEIVARVIDALEQSRIPYMIVGAFSSNAFGISRATTDVDFVISVDKGDLGRLMAALGDDFVLDRQMQLETITSTIRNVVTHKLSKFDIELFRLSADAHHQESFRRRCRRQIEDVGREAWMPTAEDVVIQKLRWQRRKDIDDAKNVLAVQYNNLDWAYLERWTAIHQTLDLLNELREELSFLDLEEDS